jgi:hypothetical protein
MDARLHVDGMLTSSQPTKTLTIAQLRERRATHLKTLVNLTTSGDQTHHDLDDANDIASKAAANKSRRQALERFIQETAPLSGTRVGVLWLCLTTALMLATKDVG